MLHPSMQKVAARPTIRGQNYAVSCGHYLATQAAMRTLDSGGNAIDAGVTASIALAVLQPDIVSLAGVAPTLIHETGSANVKSYAGLGYWPAETDIARLRREGGKSVPEGILRTVVPAAIGTHLTALSTQGTISFEEAASPALLLARNGFPMYSFLAANIEKHSKEYDRFEENAKIFRKSGKTPAVGEIFKQPDLGRTLERLIQAERSTSGSRENKIQSVWDYFYRGPLAKEISEFYSKNSGFLRLADLRNFQVPIEDSLHVTFGSLDIFCCGAWCQGLSLLQVLKMFEPGEVERLGHNSSSYIHLVAECLNIAFSDRESYVGDPAFVSVPVDKMLDPEYGAKQRSRIDPRCAFGAMPRPGQIDSNYSSFNSKHDGVRSNDANTRMQPDTICCAVIDRSRNTYVATLSDTSFDTPIVPGTGLALSSRGSQSRLEEEHPNSVQPGKRPRLTPTPAIVLQDCRPSLAFGTPGGDVQVQTMLQVLLNIFEFGMPVQEAIEAPRFATWSFPNSFAPHIYYPGRLAMESRISVQTRNKLSAMNHQVEAWPGFTAAAGGACAIHVDFDTNVLSAGADPRRECYAEAW